ncbi:MAG: UpxY family transcription antiterminator [Candidatus Neomarinimicrobiota bacterium]
MYTKSRHEKVASDQLNLQGITNYLPVVRSKRRWSDRTKWVDMPLFKSYLFARIPLKNHLYVLQTPGVHHVVRFHNEIAIVADEQIQSLKLMLEGGYQPESTDYFVIGDAAEIVAGPLRGVRGIVSRIDGVDRFVLKIDAIQNAISIHVDRGYLKAIK